MDNLIVSKYERRKPLHSKHLNTTFKSEVETMTIRRMDSETPVNIEISEIVTSQSNGKFLATDVNNQFKNRCALEHSQYFID